MSGFLANMFGAMNSARASTDAARLIRAGARGAELRARPRPSGALAEMLEARVLLAGDHPSLPGTFSPTAGTALTLDLASPLSDAQRGRAMSGANQGVSGIIASGDDGDVFRFTMPTTPGRTNDFVTVLADTQTNPNGTDLSSTLDTYVEVYRANAGNNGYQLIVAGANNGVLSSNNSAPTPDGWAGFVGTPGTTYFIRVRANPAPLAAGRVATGAYTLRVDTVSLDYAVDTTFEPPTTNNDPNDSLPGGDSFGEGQARGSVAFRQDDLIYRVTTGAGAEWDSLASAGAIADDPAMLDTHLDIYDSGNASGVVTTLASDIQAGRLTNAFATWRSSRSSTFYVRVRSDELQAARPSTGGFALAIDLGALPLLTDQTTRLSAPDRFDALAPLPDIAAPAVPFGTSSRLFQFTAQGTGTSFITVVGQAVGAPMDRRPNPLSPFGNYGELTDPAVHLYNEQGVEIAFNDDRNGFTPQLEVGLVGGQRYFLIVEGFDRAEDNGFAVFIEAHYTNIGSNAGTTDDHVNAPPDDSLNFLNATPIAFGDPTLATDADGNGQFDANWVVSGASRGRIYDANDTDLFQFTPPVSTLGTYAGNDDNQGTALYVGGNFGSADRLNSANPATGGRAAPNVAVWDADDWWNAGPGEELPGGLADGAIDGQIRAFVKWDPDGAGTALNEVLIAGGAFTIDDDGDPMTPNVPANLAARVFDPTQNRFVWANLGLIFNANSRVNALTVFDTDGSTGARPPSLIAGGRFTTINGAAFNNLVEIRFTGTAFATATIASVTGGASPEVRALTTFDAPQGPDPDGAGPATQPPDAPLALVVGGSFSSPGANIFAFGPLDGTPGTPNSVRAIGAGTNGPVNALVSFDSADQTGAPPTDVPNRLYVGGAFTTPFTNIAAWNNAGPPMGTASQWDNVGALGPVNALTVWNVPGGGTNAAVLVAGGGVDNTSGFVSTTAGAGFQPLVNGINRPVRALGTFVDQEFDISMGEQLVVGGDFDDIAGAAVGHIFRITDQNNDAAPAGLFLKGGVADLAPGESAPTTVLAIEDFDDDVAGEWDRNDRPSSRVAIVVSPTADSFLDSRITIYDSKFQIIYQNETISLIQNDPSGALDPARAGGPGTPTGFVAPGLLAGETYYIAVTGAGTGRYTISVSTDSLPPEDPDFGPNSGRNRDDSSDWTEVPGEGRFDIAPELVLNGNGDGRNFSFLTSTGRQPFQTVTRNITPSGTRRSAADYLATIETVTDTDLYQFRAAATGTVEIRISTTDLLQQSTELLRTSHVPLVDDVNNTSPSSPALFTFSTMAGSGSPRIRRMDSALDSFIRVFNNDFEELANNDNNSVVGGFLDGYRFGQYDDETNTLGGTPLTHIFKHGDARIVLPVVAGETYFIQVESSMRDEFALDPGIVDWRRATGAYELLINNTQSSNGVDDFENSVSAATLFNSSAIPIDLATGNGSISGTIDNITGGAFPNPDDSDIFSYITPSRGQATFRVTATNPALRPSIRVLDATGTTLATQTGADGGTVSITRSVQQGERLFIVVDGDALSEGTYDLTVDGPASEDDHADDGDWSIATPISLNSFLGEFQASGFIENASDTDVFTFTASATEIASVTVTAQDPTITPYVFVWEVNATTPDPTDGRPEFRLVGQAAADAPGGAATAPFAVTAGRPYFVVVYGIDLNGDFGRYDLAVNVTPTDDHPNFVDFPLATQLDLAATFNPLTFTASASDTGEIEVNADDDLFRFIAPASGTATVTVTTPDSGLAGNVFVYDSAQNLLGMGTATNGTATVTVNITASTQYYVRVDVGTTGAGQPDDTGSYTVSVNTAPVDDFANQGQFGAGNVGVITLNNSTGFGTRAGFIVPNTDTDLFRVAALFTGNLRVRVTTDGSVFNPKIRIFRNDAGNTEITGATSNGDTASLTFAATAGETYFILVLPNDGATGANAVGNYLVEVTNTQTGPGPGPGPGPDDHANAGEFGDATLIGLDSRTGFGGGSGSINFGGDTDLFKFVPSASGRAGVQVRTPSGGLVDGRVKVFDRNFTLVAEDVAGVAGATASVVFNAVAGSAADIYYVLVEPIGANTGTYSVEVSSQPTTHYLYYPEGFSGPSIDEFVPFFNPGTTSVNYQVFVRYESGPQNNNPIASGMIGARSRGGITISTRTGASLVDRGRPYALEIQSTGELGATMSHYDFDVSVGESFTNRVSTVWTFAQVNKDSANFRDFIVFYNPNNSDATLNIELFYSDGTTRSFTQTVRSLRRGGINVDADGRVPFNGRFGVRITSNIGIVSAVSSYNLANNGGDGLLGDADGGTTAGVIPNVSTGGGVNSTLSFLNTTGNPATITVTASYARVDLPDLVRVITVQPGRQFSTTLANLGLINSQTAGITYSSTAPVTASVIQYQNGDGDTTNAATSAARQYYFGDLFINPAFAGVTYIERLGLYNPSATATDINVRFVFVDGTSSTLVVNVPARDFGFVQIDQATQVLSRGRITAFSLDVSATTPIVASLTHYDLFLNGGWSTIGSPIGLTVPISTVV